LTYIANLLTAKIICVSAEIAFNGESTGFVIGGRLEEYYTFQSLHFHWGENNSIGSEHAFKGKQ